MKCEECGRQLFKDETQCPYCGRVYGLSNNVQFLLFVAAIAAIYLIYKYWIA